MPRLSDVRTTVDRSVLRAATSLPPRLQRRLAGRPVVVDGQTLATEVQLVLRLQRLARVAGIHEGSPEQGRQVYAAAVTCTEESTPVGSVHSLDVVGHRARLYVPTTATEPGPLLVWFHGGGFFAGDLDTHDGACRRIAERSGVRVLSVEYRLGPEHRFPAAHDDALAAYEWVVGHLAELDATAVGVGGDSAGGNLSAHVALEAARRGWPCAVQLLVYPMTDPEHAGRSYHLFGEGFYLTREFMDVADARFASHAHDDPRLDVLHAELPAGLAPAVVFTAGFDPLRDEGEAYAERLRAAGVAVDVHRFDDLIHGFLHLGGISETARRAIRDIADALAAAY